VAARRTEELAGAATFYSGVLYDIYCMTFEDLWKKLVESKPQLRWSTSKVTIDAINFKRALEQAYNAGKSSQANLNKLTGQLDKTCDEIDDFFKRMDGMFK